MKKVIRNLKLIENTQLNQDNFKLVLQSEEKLPQIKPGQFVNVHVDKSTETYLRRPFSILDVDTEANTISLLIKILGRASKVLTAYSVGDVISVVFPLGNGFTMPTNSDKILLIGGGSGVAPMINIAKSSGLKQENLHILIGARSEKDHIDVSELNSVAKIHRTTEDGSLGEKGFVTQHSIYANNLNTFDKVYTCGPEPMMRAVAKDAAQSNVFCEVSLENMMACGFGVCLCCVEKTKEGNQCVCTDGPVFNINKLTW